VRAFSIGLKSTVSQNQTIKAVVIAASSAETPAHVAVQYIDIELCKDSSPLPADRLRTLDAMKAVVDKDELKKATIRLTLMPQSRLSATRRRMSKTCAATARPLSVR
jgi:hypothetical protein